MDDINGFVQKRVTGNSQIQQDQTRRHINIGCFARGSYDNQILRQGPAPDARRLAYVTNIAAMHAGAATGAMQIHR